MKIAKILLVLVLIASLYARENPLFDVDPRTAPLVAAYLDYSSTTLKSCGGQETIFDVTTPFPNNEVGPGNLIQGLVNILDPTTQEFFNNLNGFIEFANATNGFLTTNYSGIITCYSVQNYTFSREISAVRRARRFHSLEDTVYARKTNIKRQIDNAFGLVNKNCEVEPDPSIVDVYAGMYDDLSTPGPNSGCQKEFLNTFAYVNRYAYVCYNKTVVTRQTYMQYYPGFYYAGLSPWNEIQASALYTNFGQVTDRSYRNLINEYCQNPVDYCTNFFNTECIIPPLPNIACGSSGARFARYNRALGRVKA